MIRRLLRRLRRQRTRTIRVALYADLDQTIWRWSTAPHPKYDPWPGEEAAQRHDEIRREGR